MTTKTLQSRVAAILQRNGHILLTRGPADDFWTLPGGRLEGGEMSDETVVRELREELGIENVRVRRLVWVIENRFAYQGVQCQEIGFFYVADLPPAACPLREGAFEGCEPDLLFQWFPLTSMVALDVRPPFLRTRLTALPEAVEYLRIDQLARP